MNVYLIVAGIVALFTTVGHFTIGSKQFLQPMLASTFDPLTQKVMHCVFHYVSAFLILSTAAMLLIGFGVDLGAGTQLLVRFIALNYAGFAVWQIALASTSGIPNGVFKMFQWIFFALIAIFGWFGS
jgi:hypothetical protein